MVVAAGLELGKSLTSKLTTNHQLTTTNHQLLTTKLLAQRTLSRVFMYFVLYVLVSYSLIFENLRSV